LKPLPNGLRTDSINKDFSQKPLPNNINYFMQQISISFSFMCKNVMTKYALGDKAAPLAHHQETGNIEWLKKTPKIIIKQKKR